MAKTVEIGTKTFIWFWVVVIIMNVIPWAIDRAKEALLVIGMALFLSIAIRPLARKVDRIMKNKERRGLSSGVAVGIVVTVIVIAIAAVGPMVINETVKFASTAPETIQETVGQWQWLDDLGKSFGINDMSAQIVNYMRDFSQSLVSGLNGANILNSVGTIGSVFTSIALIFVLTILFATQGPQLLDVLWKKLEGKNNKATVEIRRIMGRLVAVIEKYMTGQVLVALLDGLVTCTTVIVLALIFGFSPGMAFPMAMIAAIFYLIPMFGPVITAVVVTLLLFFQAPGAALAFVIFYIVYEQIENNIIAPKIQGNSLNLPTLVILISITIGMYMFGLVGAIISIPIAGFIKVLIEEIPTFRALRQEVREQEA